MTVFFNIAAKELSGEELDNIHGKIMDITHGYGYMYVATTSKIDNHLTNCRLEVVKIPELSAELVKPHKLPDINDITMLPPDRDPTPEMYDSIRAMLEHSYLQWANCVRMTEDALNGRPYNHCITATGDDFKRVSVDLSYLAEENYIFTRTATDTMVTFMDHMLVDYSLYRSDLATMFKLSHLWQHYPYLDFKKYIWPDYVNRSKNESKEDLAVYDKHIANFVFKHWCSTNMVRVRFEGNAK